MKREILPEMAAWLDNKLRENGLAKLALVNKDPRTLMRLAAQACVGIREEGENTGPLVSMLQDTVGGPDPWAWCMSFVQTCVAYAEDRTEVESLLPASEHCMTVWMRAPNKIRTRFKPLPGAIPIWNKRGTLNGHTGILDCNDVKDFYTFEGNTSKGVDHAGELVREGDGVYYCKRRLGPSASMVLKGFLKPFEFKNPAHYKIETLTAEEDSQLSLFDWGQNA